LLQFPKPPHSLHLPRLYAIVDVEACARAQRAPLDVSRAFLSGGVRCLQLRAKSWGSGPLLELAAVVVSDASQAGALVIINDRADVAVMAGAHGVHVGQDDLPPVDARTVVGADRIVGLSTHTDAQLEQGVALPISYLAVGPVFDTETKATGYDSIGLETVRRAAAIVSAAAHPLVAIGGITLQRAPGVIAAGASSVAVINDLLVGDPEARAREFLRALQ